MLNPNSRIFRGTANMTPTSPLPFPTSQTITLEARDYGANGGNVATKTYSLVVHAGPTRSSITYDKNGNCTGFAATAANYSSFIGPSGTFVYDWDSDNRLVAVHNGTLHSEFTYDGYGRCVRMVEKNGTTVTSDKRFVWYGLNRAEERDAAGNVTKRFFPQGVKVGANNFFYTEDRLGNIREMTDSSGTIRARYEYDPYGRRARVSGDLEADFGFTGLYYHEPSKLNLAVYRAYDPDLGRWINRDPIGERGGLNLYTYVENDPLNSIDPFGLDRIIGWYGGNPIIVKDDPIPGQNPFPPTWRDDLGNMIGAEYGKGLAAMAAGEAAGAALGEFGPAACKLANHNRYFRLGPGRVPGAPAREFRAAFGGKDQFIHGHIDSSNWYKPWDWFQKIGDWKNY